MHNLAVLYAEGIDGKPDYDNAVQWFRKAALRGIADSQYNLGVLCARGLGTAKSYAEAYKWFALAAAQGDKESAKKRDDIAAHMDAARAGRRRGQRSRPSCPSRSRKRPRRLPNRPAAGITPPARRRVRGRGPPGPWRSAPSRWENSEQAGPSTQKRDRAPVRR